MKTYIFESKEQYLNMKKKWAKYFNEEARDLERNVYGNKLKKLTATHFALYAILRGKDPFIALNNSSSETIEYIEWNITSAKTSKFYKGKWRDFFGLTEEQEEKLLTIAYKIFKDQKDFSTVEKEIQNG